MEVAATATAGVTVYVPQVQVFNQGSPLAASDTGHKQRMLLEAHSTWHASLLSGAAKPPQARQGNSTTYSVLDWWAFDCFAIDRIAGQQYSMRIRWNKIPVGWPDPTCTWPPEYTIPAVPPIVTTAPKCPIDQPVTTVNCSCNNTKMETELEGRCQNAASGKGPPVSLAVFCECTTDPTTNVTVNVGVQTGPVNVLVEVIVTTCVSSVTLTPAQCLKCFADYVLEKPREDFCQFWVPPQGRVGVSKHFTPSVGATHQTPVVAKLSQFPISGNPLAPPPPVRLRRRRAGLQQAAPPHVIIVANATATAMARATMDCKKMARRPGAVIKTTFTREVERGGQRSRCLLDSIPMSLPKINISNGLQSSRSTQERVMDSPRFQPGQPYTSARQTGTSNRLIVLRPGHSVVSPSTGDPGQPVHKRRQVRDTFSRQRSDN